MVPESAARKVILYDPKRRPHDWTGLLSPSHVAVFLSDVHGGQELNPQGEALASGAESSCYVFSEYRDAEQFCRELVLQFPNCQCEVFDRRGRAVAPLAIFVHPSSKRKQDDDPRRAKLLVVAGILLFLSSFPLFYFDWTQEGHLIWPSFIAVNCIGVSLRLVYWGSNILHRRKQRLTDQDRVAG